eukprot:4993637-Amphidinium_carterae.2
MRKTASANHRLFWWHTFCHAAYLMSRNILSGIILSCPSPEEISGVGDTAWHSLTTIARKPSRNLPNSISRIWLWGSFASCACAFACTGGFEFIMWKVAL